MQLILLGFRRDMERWVGVNGMMGERVPVGDDLVEVHVLESDPESLGDSGGYANLRSQRHDRAVENHTPEELEGLSSGRAELLDDLIEEVLYEVGAVEDARQIRFLFSQLRLPCPPLGAT